MDKLKQIFRYPLLLIFAVFILALTGLDLVTPAHSFTELENRYLEQKPKMTVSSLLETDEEKKFSAKYEKYTNDQFIFRDGWITLKSVSESAIGKIENNGVAYGSEDYMFEKLFSLSRLQQRQYPKNIAFLQEFAQQYPDQHITLGIAPNAYTVLADKVPVGFENVDQEAGIREIYAGVTAPNVEKLDFLPSLRAQAGAYIYYRTDHHWTTLGAYSAYADYVRSRGMDPVPQEALQPLAREQGGFYGTFYSKAKKFDALADTITYFDIPVTSVAVNGEEKGSLYDLEKLAVRDKYAAFIWSNNGLTTIKSGCNRSPRADGQVSRVMVIKDSYGNSFAPYLCYNYDEVWVVDLRYTASLKPLLEQAEFEDVLVLYNFQTFTEDSNIPKLRF